ncbi:MAG: trigger factor, partial [Alphaproteobacteria bacterium]|nr:trigger factor [Alphaproteobacteria bacterium]
MDIQEISADGLSREIKITIGKADLNAKLTDKLVELKTRIQLRGFRKGKVPEAHLKKLYGTQVMSEIVQETVSETSQQALTGRNERPALRPEIEVDGEIDPVIKGEADLVFDMRYDIIPPIKLTDFSKLKLERPVADVTEKDVTAALERLAEARKQFSPRPKTAKARKGDSVKIDFIGRIDGEAFEGGTAEGFELELGAGQFIPGFEEQLVNAQAGAKIDVKVTFPADYSNKALADKAAVFEVTVHEVKAPQAAAINDAFAESMGLESLAKLREAMKTQIGRDYENLTRERLKRNLLDILNEEHDFALPERMVELEFNQIWQQFEQELERQGKTLASMDESEAELRKEYRQIAERRVRTGLVLAEIGNKQEIEVTQEDLNQALAQHVRQYPGQEKEALAHFRDNPEAMAQIRAPIFEDKVVDFL